MAQTRRATPLLCLSLSFALAACSSGGFGTSLSTPSKDSPFAPAVKRNAQGEDPLIVGHRLSSAGEHELALKSFRLAAADQGLTTEIISAMASVNLGLGRLGQAETLLRRATNADDATPEDYNNLGVVLMERGKTAEATQVFKKAFALDDGRSDSIRQNLTIALAKLENVDYGEQQEQDYKLVRRGTSDFLIRKTP
ncbi:tetratricopeptide repeat protein [Planktotalea sp.]|uniref:tetratricopeptide repeat protein n=1 Tax=Planktotalea sp. TaxID=2029877 RepID=UPI003F6DA061